MSQSTKEKIFRKFALLMTAFALLSSGCGDKKEDAAVETKEWDGGYGDTERRIETLKSKLYESPDNAELLSALGDVYFESQRYLDAIKEYDKSLKINPKNADCLNDRGLALFYTGQHDEALDSVVRATDADPTYKHAWLSRGFILMALKRYDEAEPALKKVKELDPNGNLGVEADNFLAQIGMMRVQN